MFGEAPVRWPTHTYVSISLVSRFLASKFKDFIYMYALAISRGEMTKAYICVNFPLVCDFLVVQICCTNPYFFILGRSLAICFSEVSRIQ